MKRDYALGARIKASMKAAGFNTAKEFCEQYQVPYLTLAQHIQGRRHPATEFLEKYSKAFGVSPEWLETGEGNPFMTAKKASKDLQQSAQALMDKQLEINSRLHTALDIPLLTEIIQKLLIDSHSIKAKEAEHLAKAVSCIYNDIISLPEDQEIKIKMAGVAVSTFIRHSRT